MFLILGDGLFGKVLDFVVFGYDFWIVVYDIFVKVVYLFSGVVFEVYFGFGDFMDNFDYVDRCMVGVMLFVIYDLKLCEKLFYGVCVLCMILVEGISVLGCVGLLIYNYLFGL